jgi:hypothetical protein
MSVSNGLTLPYSIANGQTNDATQVMANYNTLLLALNRALLDAGDGSGMNAFGSQLHNLGAGSASTDAVNLGQVSGVYLPLNGGTQGVLGYTYFVGGANGPTPTTGDNSGNLATTAFVQAQLTSALASAGFLPETGGTMTGPLATAASTTATAGLGVPPGQAPTTPTNGDLWTTASGVFVRIAGATQQLGRVLTFTSNANGVAIGFPIGGVTYYLQFCLFGFVSGGSYASVTYPVALGTAVKGYSVSKQAVASINDCINVDGSPGLSSATLINGGTATSGGCFTVFGY